MKYKNLNDVVKQLYGASKMHKKQAKIVESHIKSMEDTPASKKDFKAHDMFDPKTGKKVVAKTYQEHVDLGDKGYTHEPPTKKKGKVKGGGTRKVCLPKAKVMRMSKAERSRVVNAKRSAASKGKYKRSSKSNVKGARRKGATLRDWFQKENWVQVGNPSKKCGEK